MVMGILMTRLEELAPKLNKMLKNIKLTDVNRLRYDLYNKVYHCFHALQPLSHKLREAVSKDGNTKIMVGKWIREKRFWHTFGSEVTDCERFFYIIREHGESISRCVRRPIRKDFFTLAELTKKLVPYEHLTVSKRVDKDVKTIFLFDDVSITPHRAEYIEIETIAPRELKIGSLTVGLNYAGNVVTYEDLIDDILELQSELVQKIDEAKRHNEALLEQMKELVAPLVTLLALRKETF